MAKIPASRAGELFEEIVGWPYVSPGTNDQRGIDCSGAWVRVYRELGQKIDHGSNSQYRRFCSRTGMIAGPGDLRVGMAVFKLHDWKADQKGHRDYGTAPGDLYHVGCVTRASPLRIVHATPPAAKADTALGKWAYWGMLKEVEYESGDREQGVGGSGPAAPPNPSAPTEPGPGQAKVITATSGLRLRKLPAKNGAIIKEMPAGTIVTVLRVDGDWAEVRWDVRPGLWHSGWCSTGENGTRYLEFGKG